MSAQICIRAAIHGRVQGVYYRAWTKAQAERRGLAGWVRNMPDGSVLAEFVGPADAVEEMLAAARVGPRDARVARIETEEIDPVPLSEGFRITR